jgi:hypothetical protein
MKRRPVSATEFVREAQEHFGVLVDEGFVSTSDDEYRCLFSGPEFAVEVLFDDRDGRTVVIVDAFVGERNVRASLQCLYVEAGLGPAQDMAEIARSRKAVSATLNSQAAALQRLLPVLSSPDAKEHLFACHGR